jgi:hypothetical protein
MSDEHVELHKDSRGRYKGDDAPPRNTIIFVAALMAVTTLFGLKYVFDSYLDRSLIAVRREHLRGDSEVRSYASEQLAAYRTHSQDQLREGQMPIGDAMTQLAERGRGAFVQLRPIADTNTGAREGWAAMPVVAPEPAPHAQVAPAPPPTAMPVDDLLPVEEAPVGP